jgi:Fe-S cluster biogenesis protein NfuA
MMDPRQVAAALTPIMPAFDADGVKLHVRRADAECVRIELETSAEACAECVMSRESLEQIISECLGDAGLRTARVEVIGAA